MSYARGFGLNGKSLYTNVAMPKEIWLSFTVAAANTNGLGVTSVMSNGYVEYVFMHTSQTPGVMNGHTNPNPPSGYALIGLKNNFNAYLGKQWEQIPVPTSTSQTSTTSGNMYQITALGTATAAQWQAVGFPAQFTPAVGATFLATASASIGGSATVGSPGVPTIVAVNPLGNPNQLIASSNIAQYAGSQIWVQFAAATNSSTTTLVAAAPADNTVFKLQLCYDGSSVTIDGL